MQLTIHTERGTFASKRHENVPEDQAATLKDLLQQCAADLERAMRECCDQCDDGDGHCVFPYYGVAPHTHEHATGGDWLGSTRLLPREQWGPNFREDPESPGQGVYMRCPHCGRGEKPAPNAGGEARA